MQLQLQLEASDGKTFTVDKDVACQSLFIKNMVEDLGDSDQIIPLANVSSSILSKVLEFATQWQKLASQEEAQDTSQFTQDKIAEYAAMDNNSLFELILAANFLDLRELLDVGCKTAAKMIEGKSVTEIREFFQIEDVPETQELQQINLASA